MKWWFFTLCTLNVVMLVVQWSDARDLSRLERYVVAKDVREIRLAGGAYNARSEIKKECTLTGPFEKQEMAKNLKQVFEANGIRTEIISQEADLAPAYWVYFSDFNEGVTARQKLREIMAKGMDAFIIAKGELKGNISLGVFKNIDSARRMRNIAAKKGYETNLSEIKRSEEIYWLSLKLPYLFENKDKIRNILVENEADSEMREFFCKSVASEK